MSRTDSRDTLGSLPKTMNQNYVEKRYNNIKKLPKNPQLYRGLKLTNKMKVLLISSPVNRSFVSLNVNIGNHIITLFYMLRTSDGPVTHANYRLELLLSENTSSNAELLECVSSLSVDMLQEYLSQLFNNAYVECLIYGNLNVTEAIHVVELVEWNLLNGISSTIPVEKESIVHHYIKLDDGCYFLYETENELYKTSCTLVFYQIGLYSIESHMLLDLLIEIIRQPCLSKLKIEEQLGYQLQMCRYNNNRLLGIIVSVRSNKHPQYVEKRIKSVLDSMMIHISTIPHQQFTKYKENLITSLSVKCQTIYDRCFFYWSEIKSQQYNFNRASIEIAYLKMITQEQLLDFYKVKIHGKARSKLSIHVISTATLTERRSLDNVSENIADWTFDEAVQKIDDIVSFRNSHTVYNVK